jgi:hypothetical protein
MFHLILKRALSFSAIAAFAFGLLMLDTGSPSLVSEAQACDQEVFGYCMNNCAIACSSCFIYECRPCIYPEGCDCMTYCMNYCNGVAGGGCF